MRMLAVLLCFLVSFSMSSTVSAVEREHWCAVAADGALGKWTPFDDRSLRAYVEEFLPRTEVRGVEIVFCVNESAGATAWGNLVNLGSNRAFVIGVGRRFIWAMGKHMRAVMAHEVGHLVLGNAPPCAVNSVSCEYAVDRIAMAWVGKPATIAATKESIRFLEWESDTQPITFSGVSELKKRLELLERAQ